MSDVINTPELWTVTCDHPGCEVSATVQKSPHRLDSLDELEQAGWHIGSEVFNGTTEPDFCPEHNR